MAKSLTHISIFLASPSDLTDERKAVAATIQELNDMLRTTMNVCLDLIGWETHAFPSVGIDAQDVINNQIGDDYDIFLGLMWGRFGSKTGRAGSGTEEEFNRAYNDWKRTSGRKKVMMYFSSKPIDLDDIDVEQLVKVREFKQNAGKLGLLHWGFNSVDELMQLLKLHLPHHIKDVLQDEANGVLLPVKNESLKKESSELDNAVQERDEDLGYWDYMEVFYGNFAEIATVMDSSVQNIQELTSNMNATTQRLNILKERGNYKPSEVKIVISKFSKEIFHYVNKNKLDMGRFNELYTEGIDALTKGFYLGDGYDSMNSKEMNKLITDLNESADIIKDAAKSARGFKRQINNWPSVSRDLNIAVKVLNTNIDMTIKEFMGCEKMLSEFAEVVADKLAKLNGEDEGESETGASLVDE